MTREIDIVLLSFTILCVFAIKTHAQAISNNNETLKTLGEEKVILINVAVKSRLVELLSNELARTEIIRTLLADYTKECVENVTLLEKQCKSCVRKMCASRLSECKIPSSALTDAVVDRPSLIPGVHLMKAPLHVENNMREFAESAPTVVLKSVPDDLMKQGKTLTESSGMQKSLQTLKESLDKGEKKFLDTESLSKSIQMAADEVNKLPDRIPEIGDAARQAVDANRKKTVTLAEQLASKLRDARPFVVRIQTNTHHLLENMPAIMNQVEEQMSQFQQSLNGVVQQVLGRFQAVYNRDDLPQSEMPIVPVANQLSQNQGNIGNQGANLNMNAVNGHLEGSQLLQAGRQPTIVQVFPPNQQMTQGNNNPGVDFTLQGGQMNSIPIDQNGRSRQGNQIIKTPQGSQFVRGGQFQQIAGQPNMIQRLSLVDELAQNNAQGMSFPMMGNQGNMIQGIPLSPTFPSDESQLRINSGQQQGNTNSISSSKSQINAPKQQSGQINTQSGSGRSQGANLVPDGIVPGSVIQGSDMQPFPRQGSQVQQMGQVNGRLSRQADPSCEDLKLDISKYCNMYQHQCPICGQEQRLRYDVCGDGLEKARKEIELLDQTIVSYLGAYQAYIMKNDVVLKIQYDDKNRIPKSNSYKTAFVTARIGPSITRYVTTTIVDLDNILATGKGIGEEIWEMLWENEVLSEVHGVDNDQQGNKGVEGSQAQKTAGGASSGKTKAEAIASTGNMHSFATILSAAKGLLFGLSCIVLLVI
ncbi:hypothetical protein CHS0354_024566 [Potamilus streckersoni]|uniref:Uncharacterized protein n=1 Tax=Potamilus streckersoni TaxID=2493646 RepID=A0AAE0VMT8_9BIVA|nr:hypothetical protein CHS0354_024566 [Potamilus streckersoni]